MQRIWRAFGLQLWRTQDFKISLDLLIEKIRDVARLYLAPPMSAAVFAMTRGRRARFCSRPRRCCPWCPAAPSGAASIKSGTAQWTCSRH